MVNYWKIVNQVIRDSDILLEVLDARLIDETRNPELEEKIERAEKKIILVINKSDLVDKNILDRKKKTLQNCVFVSSMDHHGSKILREMIYKLGNKEKLTVGVVGYPNTGKSSVINMLKGKASAGTSSMSGYTKGMQKVRVTNRIMLLDTPGVIPFKRSDEKKLAIIGSLNPGKLDHPDLDAIALIESLNGAVEKYYGVESCDDPEETLEKIAVKKNKMRKGGEPDVMLAARLIIQDWQNGKIRLI